MALVWCAGLKRGLFFSWYLTCDSRGALVYFATGSRVACTLRLVESWKSTRTLAFFAEVKQLLEDTEPWDLLGATCDEEAMSISFASLATAAGGVFLHLYSRHKRYPVKLFGLLVDKAISVALAADPSCLDDTFSRSFRGQFPSSEALASEACLWVLRAIAVIARTDTTRIECRHAALRRLQIMRGLTHGHKVEAASSTAVLRRQSMLEVKSWQFTGVQQGDKHRPKERRRKVVRKIQKTKRRWRRSSGMVFARASAGKEIRPAVGDYAVPGSSRKVQGT
jgi:hypothetical protein